MGRLEPTTDELEFDFSLNMVCSVCRQVIFEIPCIRDLGRSLIAIWPKSNGV